MTNTDYTLPLYIWEWETWEKLSKHRRDDDDHLPFENITEEDEKEESNEDGQD